MKKVGLWVGLLACLMMLAACASPWNTPISGFPNCNPAEPSVAEGAIGAVYVPIEAGNCVVTMPPVDQGAWWESTVNSRRIRGEQQIPIGCVNCQAGNADCSDATRCGGCSKADLLVDFTKMPEGARITAALLAVYAVDRGDLLAQAVVKGRVNVGGDYAVIASKPTVRGNWVFFDITEFACRNVVERRNGAGIEISLPCGVGGQARIASEVMADDLGPTLIFEYRQNSTDQTD